METIVANAFELVEWNGSSVWLILPAVLVVLTWLLGANPEVSPAA